MPILKSLYSTSFIALSRFAKMGHVIRHLFLLSAILCLPILISTSIALPEWKSFTNKIQNEVPPFSIQNGELTANEAFSYETDTFSLFINQENVQTTATYGLSLSKEDIQWKIANEQGTLLYNTLGIQNFSNTDTENIIKNAFPFSIVIAIVVLLLTYLYKSMLLFLFTLLVSSVTATFFMVTNRNVRFVQAFSLTSFLLTFPIILFTLLEEFSPSYGMNVLPTLSFVVLCWMTVKRIPKRARKKRVVSH